MTFAVEGEKGSADETEVLVATAAAVRSPVTNQIVGIKVLTVVTPDGVMHKIGDHNGIVIDPSRARKWEKKVNDALKRRFKAWEKRIKEFAKRIAKFRNYQGKFEPYQFKVDVDSVTGAKTYTVQFEIDGDKIVQATVYVPPTVLKPDGTAEATQADPEITQFIADDGTVVNGAWGLKATYGLMLASMVATVAMS